MNLYEIEKELMNCVDEETGEIIDIEKLEELQLEREKKIENIACWIKNLVSDAEALKAEEAVLAERRKRAESKSEQLRAYLDSVLCGSKFESSKVIAFYRKSKAVELDESFVKWAKDSGCDEYLTYKQPVPNKAAIKAAILSGVSFGERAIIAERMTLNIK